MFLLDIDILQRYKCFLYTMYKKPNWRLHYQESCLQRISLLMIRLFAYSIFLN